jgi:folylpolyglutamate synthase/dihydropteroate synthase
MSSSKYRDVDKLNSDIARCVIKLLKDYPVKSSKKFQLFRQITESTIHSGLECRPPCRFESRIVPFPIDSQINDNNNNNNDKDFYDKSCDSIEFVFDIAHNPDAMKALVAKMKNKYPNKHIT